MKSEFIYSNLYDISMYGIDKLHPFDGRKYSRAWKLFNAYETSKNTTQTIHHEVPDDDFLASVHTNNYLDELESSDAVARIIEIGVARFLPNAILQNKLLKPAKIATYGTWLATQNALKNHAIAMNFGGGYHHAFPDHGEGFCFYADAALSVAHARANDLIKAEDNILMIDLDAHRGNGFEGCFKRDASINNFDMYNAQAYPGFHHGDVNDYPFMIPLKSGTFGNAYLKILKEELPNFLESCTKPKLAFYNAGTDILLGDPLGGLRVKFDEVIERDRYVIQQLVKHEIPTVVMTSGGYTNESYKLIAKLAESIIHSCKSV